MPHLDRQPHRQSHPGPHTLPHQATARISTVQFSTVSASLASLHPTQVPCKMVEAQAFQLQPAPKAEPSFHNFQDMMDDLDADHGDKPQEGTTQLQPPGTVVQGGLPGGFVSAPSTAPCLNVAAAVTDEEKSQVSTAQQHQQHQQHQYQQQQLQQHHHHQHQRQLQQLRYRQLQQLQPTTLFGDVVEQPAPITKGATILSATILSETILMGNECTPEEFTNAKLARPRAAEGLDHNLAGAIEVWKANEAAGGVADKSLDISQASSVGTALAPIGDDEMVPECASCWGAQLNGGANCSSDFVPGKLHFKNKFCNNCKDGILMPLAQVRALSNELAACFANKRSEGFWNNAPKSMGGGQYRILNNTAGSIGPRLALFREQPPPFQWQAISRSNPHFPPKDRTRILS